MEPLLIKIKGVHTLKKIQQLIREDKPFSQEDKKCLLNFLAQIPTVDSFLTKGIEFNDRIEVKFIDTSELESKLLEWVALYRRLPGHDWCPNVSLVSFDDEELLQGNVAIEVEFAPTYKLNLLNIKFILHLFYDGTAKFILPNIKEIKTYPELYSFFGEWKDAYLLISKIVTKGWLVPKIPFSIEE